MTPETNVWAKIDIFVHEISCHSRNWKKLWWKLWILWIKSNIFPSSIKLSNNDESPCLYLLALQHIMTRNSPCKSPEIYLLPIWYQQERTTDRPEICHKKSGCHSTFRILGHFNSVHNPTMHFTNINFNPIILSSNSSSKIRLSDRFLSRTSC